MSFLLPLVVDLDVVIDLLEVLGNVQQVVGGKDGHCVWSHEQPPATLCSLMKS